MNYVKGDNFLPMKVALVHDWLTGMRGGERCLEALCEIFPGAPIYTLIHVKGSVSEVIEQHQIFTSYLNTIPSIGRFYRYFLPLFPAAIQSLVLDNYDLVLSSSHCVAKGIRVSPETCHISYVHTPMRYIWDVHGQYFGNSPFFSMKKIGMAMVRKRLQQWDVQSNTPVHAFIANSHNVAERIKRLYRRESTVVHPPVHWSAFEANQNDDEGFYLMVTAFAPYKRVDLAIQTANSLKLTLKIIGNGPEEKRLKQMAGSTVEFLGWQSDERIGEWYQNCKALIFPGEEDFGIVPLEAMACGKPVIAYGKGGALETIIPLNPVEPIPGPPSSPTGLFFYEQTIDALSRAIQLFEKRRRDFSAKAIRAHVKVFDREYFKENIKNVILTNYEQFLQSNVC